MPIKINHINHAARQSKTASLYKNGTQKNKVVVCRGNNMMKDVKFNPLQTLILKLIDAANPIIKNYPKIGNKLLNAGEKILKKDLV